MSNAASHALFARLKENRVKKTKVSAALPAFVKSLAISVFLSLLVFLKELKKNWDCSFQFPDFFFKGT